MQTIFKLFRKTLTTIKVTFFLLALVFWGIAINDGSKLQVIIALQMVWILVSSAASYFLVESNDDTEFIDQTDIWIWLLNFWATVLVAGLAWGAFWGVGIFFAMLALIAVGSLPSFFFGSRFNKSTGADFPGGFGN